MVWLAHLLAYVWIVPPWRHYDEPTHFEYAALIRELGRLPTFDEKIPSLRRMIAASMIETGFYRNIVVPIHPPDLNALDISIGVNERGHPPLYYMLVALATLPVRNAPIAIQLYTARLLSVLLAMLFFGSAYLVLRLLTGVDWQLRCAILATLALQPALADNMSSVNNDVLANLVAVLMLLAGIWFLHKPGWLRIFPGLTLMVLGFNVKRTLLIYALILPIAWLLALPSRIRQWVVLSGAVMLVGLLLWLVVQPWSLSDWTGSFTNTQSYISTQPLRQLSPSVMPPSARGITPHTGAAAIALVTAPDRPESLLSQDLSASRLRDIQGQRLTLAAWMRADRDGLPSRSPVLLINDKQISRTVMLNTHWQLITMTVAAPLRIHTLTVRLYGPTISGIAVYDGLALVIGGPDNLPVAGEPDSSFEAALLESGPPRNLLRNADAEQQIPTFATLPQFSNVQILTARNLTTVLSTFFNPAWIAAAYPRQALLLFESAWGVFGWGELGVSDGWFVTLGILVLASIVGALCFSWRLYVRSWEKQGGYTASWWLCWVAVVLGWGVALLRVHDQTFLGVFIWSFGRYTYVAMVPSLVVFIIGFQETFPKRLRQQAVVGLLCFLVLFALTALFGTVLPAAYRQ